MDKRKKSLKITKDIRNIKNNKQEEKIIVTYNNKEYEFDGEESILDTFKSVIEKDKNILAIRYGNSIRSLKHVPKKSGVLKFLDMRSEDRKNDIYKRGIICALYGN
jgi:hypothetical protein